MMGVLGRKIGVVRGDMLWGAWGLRSFALLRMTGVLRMTIGVKGGMIFGSWDICDRGEGIRFCVGEFLWDCGNHGWDICDRDIRVRWRGIMDCAFLSGGFWEVWGNV